MRLDSKGERHRHSHSSASSAPDRPIPHRSLAPFALRCLRLTWTSPLLLAGLVIVIVVWIPAARGAEGTDLVAASVEGQHLILLVCAVAYLAQALVASRPRRYGTEELEWSSPVPQWARAALNTGALVSYGCAIAVIAALRLVLLSQSDTAVGVAVWWEVLCSGITVVLAGLVGYLVGSRSNGLVVPLAMMAGISVAGFIGYLLVPWLGPWLFGSTPNPFFVPPLPAQALGRESWGRAAWLLAGCTACYLWLVAHRSGRRLPAGRIIASLIVLTVGATCLFVDQHTNVSGQLAYREDLRLHPGRYQECTTQGRITFCALPGFSNRVPKWRQIVDDVSALLPASHGSTAFTVAQYVPDWSDDDGLSLPVPADSWTAQAPTNTPIVPVSTRWVADGSGDFGVNAVAAFSIDVAYTSITGETSLRSGEDPDSRVLCGSQGAVVLYLARNANAETREAFDILAAHTGGGVWAFSSLNSADSVSIGMTASLLAEQMDSDPAGTQAALTEHWEVLTAPETTASEAAQILGLSVTDLDAGTMCESRP